MTQIKPLQDRLVIKRVEADSKTSGGIIIPDNAKEKPAEGIVVAVGSGARNSDGKTIPLELKAGDRVLFAKWGGTEIKHNGEELIILKESDVLAIINK
jgi:chaperonin GroES